MNISEAVQYLKKKYDIEAQRHTVVGWIRAGHLAGEKPKSRWLTSRDNIDVAMATKTIPPKAGRRARYTKEQRKKMITMRSRDKSLREIAKYFGCDPSLVSRICNGLR